jgi:bifunctional non-homologous end joining protein LigD
VLVAASLDPKHAEASVIRGGAPDWQDGSVSELGEYRRKRDPARTLEPFGGAAGEARQFVVQRHDARRLHYDLRLEEGGVLRSWAVPKGIPLEPGEKVLAVHVEDHPLDYASFEGEIPAGNYGAGTVEIWDRGVYELIERKRDGGLSFRLCGERLQGIWTLVPAHLGGQEKNWLLLRKRDDYSPPQPARARREPMLATLAPKLPRGTEWLFEVKWDGYRAIGCVQGGEATLRSRTGNDLTQRFPSVARELVKALRSPNVVVDGEVCALDGQGRASFSAMQQGGSPLVYELFDLLELDGEPLVDLPLRERKQRLEKLLDRRNPCVRLSESFDDGEALLAAVRQQGLEGVVAKRTDSPYRPGRRTREWLKIKTRNRQEFVIAGYTKGRGARAGRLGALILGVCRGRELVYVGNCGTGFDEKELERLLGLVWPLKRKDPPLPTWPKMPRVRRNEVVWVEPRLVCEVEFAEWTHDGHLRAPVYVGLREDKPAVEVRQERPLTDEIRHGNRRLKLSNLDKSFWPEEGITKGDLIAYYKAVAPVLVPHLRARPFTMVRYPDGWQGEHFFQKDAPRHMPDWIRSAPFPAVSRDGKRRRTIRYALVDDELALLWMVNMGCIEMHAWASRADRPQRPDWVLFDLDPTPEASFADVARVALLVKGALDVLALASLPKTSGADGMHVLVPIARRHSYAQVRELAEIVAQALASTHPDLVTTEWSKAKRRGVLIDANQNGEGKTIASVYSVRPRAGAPVSTPLRWEEVSEELGPASFTMETVLERIERDGDLFEPLLHGRQSIARALRELA